MNAWLVRRSKPKSPTPLSDADKLRAAVDEASRFVVNRYTSFLLISVYLAITIGTTTDEHLLKESNLHLPWLDVGLPIVPFYWVMPLFYLVVHLHLMLQLAILSIKLGQLQRELVKLPPVQQEMLRGLVHPFSFNHMILRSAKSRSVRALLVAGEWLTFVILPLVILGWVQRQFLPYHSEGMTWWHRGCLLADLVALWMYWPAILKPLRDGQVGRSLLRRVIRAVRWVVGIGVAAGLSVLIVAFSLFVMAIPRWKDDPITFRTTDRFFQRSDDLKIYAPQWLKTDWSPLQGIASSLEWQEKEEIPRRIDNWTAWFEWKLHRSMMVRNRTLVAAEPSSELLGGYVAGGKDYDEQWLKHVKGLDLRGRELRYADFTLSRLPKANFRPRWELTDDEFIQSSETSIGRRTDLRGAVFRNAKLEDASLIWARMEEIDLSSAELVKGDLRRASLDYAMLVATNLSSAKLCGAKLNNSNMESAVLSDADLNAIKVGGSFVNTELHGVILLRAELRRANLFRSELHNATLALAQLHSANLSSAQLHMADLQFAQLHCAKLEWTVFHGADLFMVDLNGAWLGGAALHGANLSGARLYGADLRLAALHGAILYRAELHGADLQQAKFHGAVLHDAFLGQTNFSQSKLVCSDLRSLHFDPLGDEAWDGVEEQIRQTLPEGSGRDDAIRRIQNARNRETRFAGFDRYQWNLSDWSWMGDVPFAILRWPLELLHHVYESLFFMGIADTRARLACSNEAVAKAYGMRLACSDAEPGFKENNPHLSWAMLERSRDPACTAIRRLPEETLDALESVVRKGFGLKNYKRPGKQ